MCEESSTVAAAAAKCCAAASTTTTTMASTSLEPPVQTEARLGNHTQLGVQAVGGLSRSKSLALLRAYLIATTAKDCGIMITLQRVRPMESIALESCVACDSGRLRSPFNPDSHQHQTSEHQGPTQTHPCQQQQHGSAGEHKLDTQICAVGEQLLAGQGVCSDSGHNSRTSCLNGEPGEPCPVCGVDTKDNSSGSPGVASHSARLDHALAKLPVAGQGSGDLSSGQQTSNGVQLLCCERTGQVFAYKLAYVDLDIKPSRKILAHHTLDQRIQRFMQEHLEHPLLR